MEDLLRLRLDVCMEELAVVNGRVQSVGVAEEFRVRVGPLHQPPLGCQRDILRDFVLDLRRC